MKLQTIRFKMGFASLAFPLVSMFTATSAHAADGCKFLLCVAGPWTSISQCIPTVQEVFLGVARGHPFPTCDTGGSSNTVSNVSVDQSSCPAMYRIDDDSGQYASCKYPGRVSVYINGVLWSQVFWNMDGGTSTLYTDTARANLLGDAALPLDNTFLTDLQGWNSQAGTCTNSGGSPIYDGFGAYVTCDSGFNAGG